MNIVIDTREKMPLTFSRGIKIVRKKLVAGDYSLEGLEDKVAFERKTLDDFVATLLQRQTQFKKELAKLRQYDLAAVFVEGNSKDISLHNYKSAMHPNSVFGAANAIFYHFHIPVFFWGERHLCRLILENLLKQIWKRHLK